MKTTFQVQGVQESTSLGTEVDKQVNRYRSKFDVKYSVRLESKRAGVNTIDLKDLDDSYVMELTFEDDIKRWMTVEEFREEFGGELSQGRAAGDLVIPQHLGTSATQSRGVARWLLKTLKVFDFDPIDAVVGKAGEIAAGLLANHIDERLVEKEDLYRMEGVGTLSPLGKDTIESEGPALILMHGTISNTEKSFKKLPADIFDDLKTHFKGQVYAFEHHTLSRHPIENALNLLERIPEGKRVRLLSTSRGGLIGELIARSSRLDGLAAFDDIDLELFLDKDLAPFRKGLVELNKVLTRKKITIEQFVRVACPSGGTTLASGRLDRWLEGLLNVLGKVTGADISDLYGIITDFLLEVKRNSASPEEMPGLACQIPTSSLIRMINRRDIEVDSKLSVIAGDIEGAGILGKIGIFFTDLFYLEDHDLVVPTRAMYGGVKRKDPLFFFDQGAEVSHFNYMRNETTNNRIKTALKSSEPDELKALGFRSISEARHKEAAPDVENRSYQKRSGSNHPVVFVLPGIMGSHLSVRDKRVWINPFSLSRGHMNRLKFDEGGNKNTIEADGLIGLFYGQLVDYLSASHIVIPFPYDWRKSILKEAERFRAILHETLDKSNEPVRIVAHSMGGLIARAALDGSPEVYKKFKEGKDNRLIMLGTPNQGSFEIIKVLTGRSQTLKQLAAFDLKNKRKDLLEIVSRYPGILELLPFDDEEKTYFDINTWERLLNLDHNGWKKRGNRVFKREWKKKREWVLPFQEQLDRAKALHSTLGPNSLDPSHTIYIAGYDSETPVGIKENKEAPLSIMGTTKGDGSVPWETGIPKGLIPWYMPAKHNQLASHSKSFAALSELLENGKTELIPSGDSPPWGSRSAVTQFEMHDEELEVFPEEENIEAMLFGEDIETIEPPKLSSNIKVSVSHGDLAFSRDAVFVGHYAEQPLLSAEEHLDFFLNNRLKARLNLGNYPGMINSSEVILAADKEAMLGGAVIIGLGVSGELTPQKLVETYTSGLINYAIEYYEQRITPDDERTVIPITFSTLLVGSGGWGVTIEESVRAILKSIQRANERLNTNKVSSTSALVFDKVQFIEIYQDRAIEALRIAKEVERELIQEPENLNASSEINLNVNPVIERTDGGLRRIMYRELDGWVQPLSVRSRGEDSLIFTAFGGRARAEESSLAIQLTNMDRLIEQAIHNSRWDTELASAMFELLIPNSLKGYANNQKDLVMIVDEISARYPWELLHDRRAGDHYPLVTQVGYIRRFATTTYRQNVEDVNKNKVFIVGNPQNLSDDFKPLPGASREAEIVREKLSGFKYEITDLIEKDAISTNILVKLMADDYKIIHLAGHGVNDYEIKDNKKKDDSASTKKVTGMVLGDNIFLTANELRQMPKVPELVFVNCCFLGTLKDFESNRFAASFARQLIEMGVKAVVAAGWEVDDTAAQQFAEVFYQQMLEGRTFGEAVKKARKAIFDEHGTRTNTWGAYQCYGNPNYTLQKNSLDTDETWEIDLLDREELEIELSNLRSRAQTASWQRVSKLRDSLNNLEKHVEDKHPTWLDVTNIKEAFADAFKEVNLFDKSISYYEKATLNEDSKNEKSNESCIKSIEQLATIRARKAAIDFEEERIGYDEAKDRIQKSVEDIKSLNSILNDTSERLSLLGSAEKRLAMIAGDRNETNPKRLKELKKTRLEALAAMATFYEDAFSLSKKQERESHYPITNEAFALVLTSWLTTPESTDLSLLNRKLKQALKLAKEVKTKKTNSFWDAIGVSDVEFVQALYYMAGGKKRYTVDELRVAMEALAATYIKAWKQFGSASKLRSVIEQLHVLLVILKTEDDFLPGRDLEEKEKNAILSIFNNMHQQYIRLMEQER